MATDVTIPKIGFSMAEGILVEWLVADGASVEEGQPIYTLESDKSANEVEAPASGVLKILVEPSEDALAVGTVVGQIG